VSAERRAAHPAAIALTALAFLAICVATLTPSSGVSGSNFWCIACSDFGGVDVVANVVLFIPLGFAAALATGRPRLSIALCVATTVAVEMLQVRVVPGRDASLGDLLGNSLGGALGVLAATRWRSLVWPSAWLGTRLAVAWALFVATILTITSWGLRPAHVPVSLWIQRVPQRPSYEPFTGTLLSFDVDGVDLPTPYPRSDLRLSDHLARDTWTATAVVDTRGLRPTRSIIVRVAEEFTPLVWIDQIGWSVTCLQKTRSGDVRFRSPRASLANALRATESLPSVAKVRCSRRHGGLRLEVERGGATRAYHMALTPSLGWLLLSPFDIAFDDRYRIASALWLAALVFPLGYWVSSARRGNGVGLRAHRARPALGIVAGLAIVIAVVGGLEMAPRVLDVATARWWEWIAAGVALGLGMAASGLVRRRHARTVADDR
jgi:hypothetical protein